MALQTTFPPSQSLMSPEACKMNWDSARYDKTPVRCDKTPVRRLQDEIFKMNISPPRNVLQPWNPPVDDAATKSDPFSTPSTEYFRCDACDLPFSSSRSMFDHIHGIKHQRRTGMLMELDRSSLDEVKSLYAIRIQELEGEEKPEDDGVEKINFYNYERLKKQHEEANKYRGIKRSVIDDDDDDEYFDDPNMMSPCAQVYARSLCAKKLRFC